MQHSRDIIQFRTKNIPNTQAYHSYSLNNKEMEGSKKKYFLPHYNNVRYDKNSPGLNPPWSVLKLLPYGNGICSSTWCTVHPIGQCMTGIKNYKKVHFGREISAFYDICVMCNSKNLTLRNIKKSCQNKPKAELRMNM